MTMRWNQPWQTAILILVLAVILTGCLRSASDDTLEELEGQDLNTPTPSLTAQPTILVTQPVEVTRLVSTTPEPTMTPDPLSQEVFPAQSVGTEVASADNPALDIPAAEAEQLQQPTEDLSAQQQEIPPNLQTATAIIQEATQVFLDQTATAQGPPIPVGTATPTQNLFATATPTFAQQPPVSGSNCVHQVVAGENMFRLSLRYGVSINDIAAASGVANANLILPGDRLVIPGCGTTGAVPPPTSPATTGDGTGGTVGGGNTGTGGSAGGRTHVVQQYESLFEISMQYGVPVQSIANANGISNINLIFIGDQLVIP